MKKILCVLLIVTLVFSMLTGCDSSGVKSPDAKSSKLDLGNITSEVNGNTGILALDFSSQEEALDSMSLVCANENFELYYLPDNMVVAIKDIVSGAVMLSNPYNAALDDNYSGVVGKKLDSQIVLSYLENETKIVDLYSSTDCADKGQYVIKTYDNGLAFDLTFGEDNQSGNYVVRVLSKERYEEIVKNISKESKDLIETYYAFYDVSELSEAGVYDLYPDIKKQNLYFCSTNLSERDQRKLSAVFEEAGYTAEEAKQDAEKLELGDSTESNPYFKLTLQYLLTDTGVTVNIPNDSLEYNDDYPLLRISVLPYFGADQANQDANGYLFIPDGSGTVIDMNQNEPNRRRIITGKVYGENSSKLPAKTAVEKVEQYYLPVFGTVRNNASALFGIITSGDANAEITSILGRPNGNYYAVNPEFIIADYEQYTRISVVSNAWSNKTLYLYDNNTTKDDITVQYSLLTGNMANYSAMAQVYRNYLFKDDKADKSKPTINLQTLGSALINKRFLGFSYDSELVFTSYDDDISILKELVKNKAGNVSLMLKGWQEDGLDAAISSKIRVSSALGGKNALKKLTSYCGKNNIAFSLYNDFSFVGFDKPFDGFSSKKDATKTLELKYAKNSSLNPDTMLYDDGKYVVKSSSYKKYLMGLVEESSNYSVDNLNLGSFGSSLNADYTKDSCINRSQSLSYVKNALKSYSNVKLSFDKGNAYVLPFANNISNISTGNSGFTGETAAVPFIQMVLSGNADYNSEPVNLKEDLRTELLKCIEGGTVPTFMLSYKNTYGLKNTMYTAYYSVDYEILKNSLLKSYQYVNQVVDATDKSRIISHEILAKDITVSTYENGTKVYVNKSDKDYVAGDVAVSAYDYTIKG